MTCREKWENAHPGLKFDLIGIRCPWHYGYLGEPEYCTHVSAINICNRCWDREIPEEPKKKEEKTMNNTNIMLCTNCIHRDVCKNDEEFKIVQLAITSMKIDLGGDNNIVRLCDIPYIKPVELQCKYFRKEVNVR